MRNKRTLQIKTKWMKINVLHYRCNKKKLNYKESNDQTNVNKDVVNLHNNNNLLNRIQVRKEINSH